MDTLKILLGPVISEKSMEEASNGRYTFKVFSASNKNDIRKAIEEKFKVNVLKISTVTIKGRSSRSGVRRVETIKQPFKKAMVTLKEGQKIALFDSGSQK